MHAATDAIDALPVHFSRVDRPRPFSRAVATFARRTVGDPVIGCLTDMSTPRIRVMVGEGMSTRKDLFRFVLENEGYDVVAEARSTLELAQKIVVHRPDVVVLDEGIDASAVGMLREVLPSAKVILVWPRGVAAIGADARLEPDEVMTSLGSTIARVMGRGSVIAPPRPRVAGPDVIVVPESEEPTPGQERAEPPASEPPSPVVGATSEAPVGLAGSGEPGATGTATEPIFVAPERLSDVMMEPSTLEAPRWTYTAATATRDAARRRWVAILVVVAAAILVAVVVGIALIGGTTIAIRSLSGSVGSFVLPGHGGTGSGITTEQPGTFHGVIRARADGTVHLVTDGTLHLQISGTMRLVAYGDVKVRATGVVQSVSALGVRVRGDGTLDLVVNNGQIRLSLQGSLSLSGQGTVRIGGNGRFLITHHPV
jgi:hypothetical protein